MEWTRLRRELIGIVFQAFHLIPGLTVAENVALPILLQGRERTVSQGRIDEALQAVGMEGRRSHRPSELSGVSSSAWRSPGPSCIGRGDSGGRTDGKFGFQTRRRRHQLFRTLPQRFRSFRVVGDAQRQRGGGGGLCLAHAGWSLVDLH